ncbi:MAG: hypothetical protein AB8C84_00155 [Oligoflexales bacterium]
MRAFHCLFLFLSASCGAITEAPRKSEPITQEHPQALATTRDSLHECDNVRENQIIYLIDEKKFVYCSSESWVDVDMSETQSTISTAAIAAGDTCAAGGIEVRVGNDLNKDQVITDIELKSREIVCNGAQGEQGKSGEKGDGSGLKKQWLSVAGGVINASSTLQENVLSRVFSLREAPSGFEPL